ncbi:MAG: hypothetical protein HUJ94_02315 [Bacteroidales bacterium]|nr:hypothetical protein [Bacteroidales bacterium]
MTRQETLNAIYSHLKETGKVKHKRDFAQKINFDYAGVSSALHGNARYLTNGLFSKIQVIFPEEIKLFPVEDLKTDVNFKPKVRRTIVPKQITSSTALGCDMSDSVIRQEILKPSQSPKSISSDAVASVSLSRHQTDLIRLLNDQQELLSKSQDQTTMAIKMVGQLSEEIRKMNELLVSKYL